MVEDSKQNAKQSESASLGDQVLNLECELQKLRLELDEKERLLATARHDLSLEKKNSGSEAERDVRVRLERLFTDMGGFIVQMVAQDHLSRVEGKTIHTKDLLAVANRSIECLKGHGLVLIGSMGESGRFDARIHEPLSLDEKLADGDRVTIRMVGLSYSGAILRRAAVTREQPKSG